MAIAVDRKQYPAIAAQGKGLERRRPTMHRFRFRPAGFDRRLIDSRQVDNRRFRHRVVRRSLGMARPQPPIFVRSLLVEKFQRLVIGASQFGEQTVPFVLAVAIDAETTQIKNQLVERRRGPQEQILILERYMSA